MDEHLRIPHEKTANIYRSSNHCCIGRFAGSFG